MAEALNPACRKVASVTAISREIREISDAVVARFLVSGAIGLIYEVM